MKRQLIAVTITAALLLGPVAAFAQGPEHGGPRHHGMGGMRGEPLEQITKDLNLTADQQAKIQPIIDQAKPQIKAIHEEAMQKVRAIMEASATQIRPLLTAEQQTKFDAIKKAHEDMLRSMQELHQAKQQ